jgi:hypothetical protein
VMLSDSGDVKDQYGIEEARGTACRNLTLNVILEWHKVVLKAIERRVIVHRSGRNAAVNFLWQAWAGVCARRRAAICQKIKRNRPSVLPVVQDVGRHLLYAAGVPTIEEMGVNCV